VIKEIPVEVVVEKIVKVSDDTQVNELLSKIQQLESLPPKVVEVIKEIPVIDQEEIDRKISQKEQEFEQKQKELLLRIQQLEDTPPQIVEKEVVDLGLKSKFDALQNTVQKLKLDNIEKDKQIREYEKTIEDIQKFQMDKKAAFLKGSNLDETLYK